MTNRLAAVGADMARGAVSVDRSKLAVDVGIRSAIGVGVPLIAGQASGHPLVGAVAATGALTSGLASLQGTYRTRAAVVIAATTVFAVSAFVGATVGHLLGADIVLTAAFGFLAGLAFCLGPAASAIGVQAVVGLVVFSQFTFPVTVAVREAALAFAGGAVQMLLIVVLWPIGRFSAERKVLGRAFDALADYSRAVAAGSAMLFDPLLLDDVGTVLRDPQPFGGREEEAAYQGLASQAGRLRLELAALERIRARLIDMQDFAGAVVIEDVLRATSYVLSEVAAAVRESRVPTGWEGERDQIETAIDRLGHGRSTGWTGALESEGVQRSQAMAGQLRAVARLAAAAAGGDPSLLEEAVVTGRPMSPRAQRPRFFDPKRGGEKLATVRANLTLSSDAYRHGLRLAGALAVAVALSHAFALQHRYWLPLTVMIVLRPEFGSTFTRGLSRVVGTLIGAGLVTLALAELRPGPVGLTVLAMLFCFGATSLLLANYAMYSVCIASLVVTLLAFNGAPDAAVAAERSFYTVIGAVVALLAYLIWPTWAATSLPDRLADLIDTQGRYGSQVLAAWSDPGRADRSDLDQARLAARVARSNTEAMVDRWMGEPAQGRRLDRHQVLGALAAVRNCVPAILSLHAQIPTDGPCRPEVGRLASEFGAAMHTVAGQLRTGAGRPLPALRSTQLEVAHQLGLDGTKPDETRSPDPRSVLLVGETDLMVNSANTLGHLLGVPVT